MSSLSITLALMIFIFSFIIDLRPKTNNGLIISGAVIWQNFNVRNLFHSICNVLEML